MKHFITLAMAGLLAGACTNQNSNNISGEIAGLENDTIIIFANDPVNNKSVCIDTVPVVNNKFATNLPDSIILSLNIIEKPYGNGAIRMAAYEYFTMLPGDKLHLSGDISNLKVSGTEIYDELNKIESINEIKAKAVSLSKMLEKAFKEQNKEEIDSLRNVYIQNAKELSTAKLEYIKGNPNTLVSGFLYNSLMLEHKGEAINILGENVKNGPLGSLISKTTEQYNTEMAKRKAKENIAPGKPAPDFKLKNLKNEEMTLSSFSGKYVLLDFWGTWCGWCIKGMPDMKKYYAKYKNKMEIVGICCGDTEDKWRKGVKDLELPWTNLFNGKGKDIIINYAISGYPTKILIDPKGNIVEVFVGESEEMYKKLDELFK